MASPDCVLPLTGEQFLQLMDDIDRQLVDADMPIPGRPIEAVRLAALKFHADLLLAPLAASALPDIYNAETLPAHIKAWFDTRYGDRLKVDWSIGSTAVLLRGTPWKMRIPLMYGTIEIICSRNIDPAAQGPSIARSPGRVKYNALRSIERLPEGLAAQLGPDELTAIWCQFVLGLKVFSSFRHLASRPLLTAALADMSAAVEALVAAPPRYGQSRWSSLQGVEKMMKCLLVDRGQQAPQSHNLSHLAALLCDQADLDLPAELLASVQCSAGVRYGEIGVTLSEAVAAHDSALHLLGRLGPAIAESSGDPRGDAT